MVDRQLPDEECFSEYFREVSRLPKLHRGNSRQLHWWGRQEELWTLVRKRTLSHERSNYSS